MPIIRAAVKALRQANKHRTKNRAQKDKMKELIKQIDRLGRDKKFDELKTMLPEAFSIIDKAAKNHLIAKNTAARKKSRLSRLLSVSK